jgi:hypothetical protein
MAIFQELVGKFFQEKKKLERNEWVKKRRA